MKKQEFLYETSFSNIQIKPLVSFEKDEYLALASIEKIGKLLPEIDTEENIDLLPVAFNACVVNRVNKNGDVVDTQTAMAMYKNFINKQVNIEHNRERVIGVILKAGFSEFGTDEPMDEVAASEMKGPFNITLGGVIWKTVNSNIAKIIEDSSDPTSENYMKISASWELGFNNYHIVSMDDEEKNLENCETISEASEVENYKKYLKAFGGKGELENGKKVYRKVVDKVLPLGIGLTENPAADVQGVLAASNIEENEIKSSQNETENVIINNNNNMKIEKLEDINDALLKEVQASVVTDFIQDKLKEASEQYVKEKADLETKLAEAASKLEELLKSHDSTLAELTKFKEELAAKQAEETFNLRMAKFDSEYELTNEDRQVIASDIASLDEESFSKYVEKMKVLLSSKSVEFLKKQAEAASSEVVASVSVEQEATEVVVEEAIEKAEQENVVIANSTQTQEKTLKEKFAKAFTLEGFRIKI